MRHLKLILVIIFFGLVPASIFVTGLELYLEYRQDADERSAFAEMEDVLGIARNSINNDAPKREVAKRIKARLDRRQYIPPEYACGIADEFEKHDPGVFMVFIFDIQQELITHRDFKYRKGLEALARGMMKQMIYGEQFEDEWQNYGEIKKVIGKSLSPLVLGRNREEFVDIELDGKRASAYWTLLVNPDYETVGRMMKQSDKEIRNTRFPVLFVITMEDEVEKHFNIPAILSEVEKTTRSKEKHIELSYIPSDQAGALARFEDENPELSSLGKRIQKGAVNSRGRDKLYAFQPIRSSSGKVIYATRALDTILPWKKPFFLVCLTFAVLYALGFIILAIMTEYGGFELAIPLRVQFAALFVLAAAPPIASIFYLGFSFVEEKRQVLENSFFDELREKVLSVGERAHGFVQELEEFSRWARELKATKNFDTTEVALKLESVQTYKEILVEFYLFDRTGEILLCRSYNQGFPAKKILGSLARAMMSHNDRSMKVAAGDDMAGLVLTSLPELGTSGSGLLRNPDRLTDLDLPSTKAAIFLSPIFAEKGRVKGAIMLLFDRWNMAKKVLKDMIYQSEHGEDTLIKLRGGHMEREGTRFKKRFSKYPSEDVFSPELLELFDRIGDTGGAQQSIVNADGEKYIAWGTIASGLADHVLIAMTPYSRVDAAISRYVRIFVAIIAFTILLAISLGVIIAWKFIRPFVALAKAVEAMGRGDLSHRMSIESDDEFGRLSATFNRMIGGLEEKERLSRFVSEFVRSEVIKDTSGVKVLEGELMKATVLFADLAGFDLIVATERAETVISLLDEFMRKMPREIKRNGGVIDKFIGESIMAVFYPDYPEGAKNDEARAVSAALSMKEELVRWNISRKATNQPALRMRIGINTGEVIKGNIGARGERMDLTVIGDNVNLAARLKGVAGAGKEGGGTTIILSEKTYSAVESLVRVEKMELRKVRGKTKEVEIYEITGLAPLESFESLVTSDSEENRLLGLHLVSLSENEGCVARLLTLLSDPARRVRREAASAIKNFASVNTTVVDMLLDVLEKEEDEALKAELILDIGSLGTPAQKVRLEKFLEDSNPRVRANTIEALSAFEVTGELVLRLRPYLDDPNNRVRANTCVKLASLGYREAQVSLYRMVASSDPLMRASGGWALGEIASRERLSEAIERSTDRSEKAHAAFEIVDRALSALYRLLDDDDAMVVRNAVKSLKRISDTRSVEKLVIKYNRTSDFELRTLILDAMDGIGSYHFVRILKERG